MPKGGAITISWRVRLNGAVSFYSLVTYRTAEAKFQLVDKLLSLKTFLFQVPAKAADEGSIYQQDVKNHLRE